MSLNVFPPEVTAQILQYHSSAAILLWLCGDKRFNYKLQHGGCLSLALIKKEYYNKGDTLPKLIFTDAFQQLVDLYLACDFTLPANTLANIKSACVRSCYIECPNLATVVNGHDYATHWPQLERLILLSTDRRNEPKGILNLVPLLPPTITELKVPLFTNASLLNVVRALPRDLVTFKYAPASPLIKLLIGCRSEQEVLDALPPCIKHLKIGNNIWNVLNTEPLKFPPQLNALQIHYNKDAPVALPQQLEHLVVYNSQNVTPDPWLKPPTSVTQLVLKDTRVAHSPRQLFTPTQWLQFVPPQLTVFKCHPGTPLPIQWESMSRDHCIWPATLQVMTLYMTLSSDLDCLSLPSSLLKLQLSVRHANTVPYVAFTGLVTQQQTPRMTHLTTNFALSQDNIAQLPTSLISLNTTHGDNVHCSLPGNIRDYRHLTRLQELYVSSNDIRLEPNQQLLLPDSLTSVIKNISIDGVLTSIEACRFLRSLPSKLRRLEVRSYFCLRLDVTVIQALPSQLQSLTLSCVSLSTDALQILEALPRTLQSLRLSSSECANNQSFIAATHFKTILPPRLKRLFLHSWTFDQFDFTQPIPSLQVVELAVSPKINSAALKSQFDDLFPNAHTINLYWTIQKISHS